MKPIELASIHLSPGGQDNKRIQIENYLFTKISRQNLRLIEMPEPGQSILISFGTWIIHPFEGEYYRVELY